MPSWRANNVVCPKRLQLIARLYILGPAVDRIETIFGGQPDAAHIESDKMRRQQNHRPAVEVAPVLQPLDFDQSLHPRFAPPPQDAMFEDAARKSAEMTQREDAPLGLAKRRKTKLQIEQHHAATRGGKHIQQATQRCANTGQHRQRQKMQQPDAAQTEPHHHAGLPRKKTDFIWVSAAQTSLCYNSAP